MGDLKLHLFGAPLLEADGVPVAFDTRKAFALLAYLALHDPQHRDVLGALLWPDQDAVHARGALRRTLSAVKKSVPDAALVTTRDVVGLRPGAIWVDVVAFRSQMVASENDRGALERAAELYRDDFLSGFALRDAPRFDDWLATEREALRREAARCLARLSGSAVDDGRVQDALTYLTRWVDLDPLDETAHRKLMEAHLVTGDRAAALRRYEECARILDEELAVSPLEETTALYESIRGGTQPRPPMRAVATEQGDPTIPFVGRSEEIESLLTGVADDRTRLIVIEGEAGIGKTALLDHAMERSAPDHLEVRCHEEEQDHAFGAIARLLRVVVEDASTNAVRSLDESAAREGGRLIPEIRTLRGDLAEPAPLSDPGARTAFFEGVWSALIALRGGDPSLIVVDDAHWLDEGSFELLASGIRRPELDVKVVATWRTEEVGPGHPLHRFVSDLERSTAALQIVVPRLRRGEVDELVGAAAPDSAPSLAATLFEESEGVPFFIVEYLRSQRAGGAPSGGVDGFVRSQVARLSPVAQQVLAAASVIGRSSDLDLLRAVAGRNDEETIDAIEELATRRLLLERPEGYDFAHEKVRQVVYRGISLARARLLHGRAHDHLLIGLGQRPETRALAAYHAHKAGRDAQAAEHYLLAGEHARSLGANVDALGHLQNALALGHHDAGILHEAIGDVQTLLGRYGDALASYRTALSRTEDAWRLEHKLGRLYLRRREGTLAHGHLQAAAEQAPEGYVAEHARIDADLALALRLEGDEEAARRAAERALTGAVATDDAAATAQARNILGLLERDPDKALTHLEASEAAARAAADSGTRIAALNNISLVHRRRGEPQEAIRTAAEALELCIRRGDVHRQAALHNNLADAFHETGDEGSSREHARAAATLFAQVGEPGVMSPEIWKLVEW